MPTPTGLLTLPVVIPNRAIEILCQRHHIRKLALFGFVLRPDFHRNSDVDRTFGVSSSLMSNSCYPDQIIVLDIAIPIPMRYKLKPGTLMGRDF